MFSLDQMRSRLFVLMLTFICTVTAGAQQAAPANGTIEPAKPGGRPNLVTPKSAPTEDWSTPSLQGSKLTPIDPLVGEVDDSNPDFTRELTRVQWRAGDPIDLFIVKPTGVKKPPVILYLYSYPADNDRFYTAEWCQIVTKNGFAAVGFVSALTGERYHNRPMKDWFVSELKESLSTSAHDVQMILNYLATRGDVDMDRVGMYGNGSGASIAVLAAAADPRIKTLDLIAPWGDWPDWIAKSPVVPEKERAGFLKPEWLDNVAPLDPVKWLPELKAQKIRIQDVATIAATPAEVQEKIEVSAPANAKIDRYKNMQTFGQASTGGKALDWIKEQLQSGPTGDSHPLDAAAGKESAKDGKQSQQ